MPLEINQGSATLYDFVRLIDFVNPAIDTADIWAAFNQLQTYKEDIAYPLRSERSNIVVICDEAHRSQYGFMAQLPSPQPLSREESNCVQSRAFLHSGNT